MQINIMIYTHEPHFEVYQATKSITRHAFVEFIKNSIFLLKHGFLTIPMCFTIIKLLLSGRKKTKKGEKNSAKRINLDCEKIVEFQ